LLKRLDFLTDQVGIAIAFSPLGDEHRIETCPVNCLHPTTDEPDFATAAQLYVNPTECIDGGARIPVCPTTSIFDLEELPAELQEFVQKDAAHFN
jgi:NAD-dependent dihydropyrimidine dehydrogenase PreA subunit